MTLIGLADYERSVGLTAGTNSAGRLTVGELQQIAQDATAKANQMPQSTELERQAALNSVGLAVQARVDEWAKQEARKKFFSLIWQSWTTVTVLPLIWLWIAFFGGRRRREAQPDSPKGATALIGS